jgi:deoxycytidylate deaminase
VDGAEMFVTVHPCFNCAKMISAVGITRVYYVEEYHPEEWEFYAPLYEGLQTEFVRILTGHEED